MNACQRWSSAEVGWKASVDMYVTMTRAAPNTIDSATITTFIRSTSQSLDNTKQSRFSVKLEKPATTLIKLVTIQNLRKQLCWQFTWTTQQKKGLSVWELAHQWMAIFARSNADTAQRFRYVYCFIKNRWVISKRNPRNWSSLKVKIKEKTNYDFTSFIMFEVVD